MKKMRDDALKSPGNTAAAGPSGRSYTSPAVNNAEMNNVVSKQNAASAAGGKEESRMTSDTAAGAAAASVSDRTSDPSVSEASVSW